MAKILEIQMRKSKDATVSAVWLRVTNGAFSHNALVRKLIHGLGSPSTWEARVRDLAFESSLGDIG